MYSALEGNFRHPHGRPWAESVDRVLPLMAEIVGKDVPENVKEAVSLMPQSQVQSRKKYALWEA